MDHPICDQQDVNPPQVLLLISARDPSTIPTKPLHSTLRLEGIIEQEETTITIYLKVPPNKCYGLQHLTSSTSDHYTNSTYVNHFPYEILHNLCLVVDVNHKVAIKQNNLYYVHMVSQCFYHTIHPMVNLAALSLKVRPMLPPSIRQFLLGGT